MGVKSFFHELKIKSSPSRLFKALTTDSHDVIPKVTDNIKSIEVVEGHGVSAGCVLQTNFPEGSPLKYMKNRIDEIDTQNYACKYTLVEGDVLGDKLEKVCTELKIEASKDGGYVIKVKSDYHTKGDFELKDEEVNASKEESLALFKACDEYLVANPHVCA